MGFETESTREPEDSMSMETGQDMGGRVEAAAAMYPQHEKYCLTFGCGKLKGHDGDHSGGPLNKLVANQQVKNRLYQEAKIVEQGYPGLGPSTSQADVIQKEANTSSMYAIPPEDALRLSQQPAVWMEYVGDDKVILEVQNIPNDQAMRIVKDVLPGLLELYLKKSKDYGGDVGAMIGLGPKAHFVDMWRKMGKLKRALWDGVELEGEKPEEIMRDLVGHIFIILDSG